MHVFAITEPGYKMPVVVIVRPVIAGSLSVERLCPDVFLDVANSNDPPSASNPKTESSLCLTAMCDVVHYMLDTVRFPNLPGHFQWNLDDFQWRGMAIGVNPSSVTTCTSLASSIGTVESQTV
jgi:hypothetical protein